MYNIMWKGKEGGFMKEKITREWMNEWQLVVDEETVVGRKDGRDGMWRKDGMEVMTLMNKQWTAAELEGSI